MAIMISSRSISLLSSSTLISLLSVFVLVNGHEFTIKEATIDGIQRAFTEKRLTSRQLVNFYLHQIETLNPVLRGVIEVNPDAKDQAEEADRERERKQDSRRLLGDLHGIPVLLKDSIATKDKLNTTVGSYALLGSEVPRDATVVERLRKAGAVILGKASVSEWYNFRSWSIPDGWCARSGQGLSMEEGKSSSSQSVEFNERHFENEVENEIDKEKNVEQKIEDPKVGMIFDTTEELVQFYQRYAKAKGFGVSIRSSKKVRGELRYVTVACNHTGKPRIKSSKLHQLHPQSKTDCKAKICAVVLADGKLMLSSMVLEHNHGVSPGKARFYRCHRALNSVVKRRLELNVRAGIRMNKNFNSFVVEAGGHENLPFLEKDCRNYIDKIRRLQLGEGDATAMHNYFLKMQADNSNFFYMMDLDEDGRLRNVFWADARSIAAFKEFGDVVTFDTTYLVNKYAMPFAPFVGVNHHGQSTLLGCGLISNEDVKTFIWLFQSWLACMSGCPPSAIITDQDKAMKKAIEVVFPNARHRWCLWHIMKKLPEKLRGYKQYEEIKFTMQNVIYDSLSKEEFEEHWDRFIEEYKLENNEWLLGLYDERHRWVLAFVKDIFWVGMSTTQRSESMNAFFDGYVNSKTTLKQFVEQYENALAKKVENENNAEFNSFNSSIPCIIGYEMEKQFQSSYTREKFKEFQRELIGKIACDFSSYNKGVEISKYEVAEDVVFGDSRRRVTFNVCFYEDTGEVDCNCRLFEYRRILCRHQIVVFIHRKVDQVPDKYILRRWSKNVKRSHTKVRICYDNSVAKPEARRFDKMCNAFYEVADMAVDSEDWCDKVIEQLGDLKIFFKEEGSGSNKYISKVCQNDSISCEDGFGISKESTNILDPSIVHQKGRPPYKRKQSKVEKLSKKKKEGKKKTHPITSEENLHKRVDERVEKELEDHTSIHGMSPAMGFVGLGTQESINLNDSTMQQSRYIGEGSYDIHRGSLLWPNMIGQPSIGGMSPYFGQPSMLQGGSVPFQPSMLQGGNMYPFMGHHYPSTFWRANFEMTAMPPTNFTGMLAMGDLAHAENPRLHSDGRSEES